MSAMQEHSKLVVIKSCGNRIEAELVKGALEAAGIQAMIQADSVGRMREHIAWSGAGFKILVREGDAAAAMRSAKLRPIRARMPASEVTMTLDHPGGSLPRLFSSAQIRPPFPPFGKTASPLGHSFNGAKRADFCAGFSP
jgi:hypothetical protein